MSTLLIDFDIGSYALKDMKLSCASLEEIISNLNLAEASMKIGGKSCKNYGKIINMIESSKNINKSELQKIRSLQSGFSSFLKYAQQKENECVKIIKDDSTTFRVNKGLEVSGWVKAVEIGGTILIVGGLIVSAVLTGGSSLLICASIGAAAGAGMGYYKNRDSKNPWGHALFGAIKGGATGAMMSQMGPQLLAAGSQLSTVGLSGAALKTAGLKYVAEIFTKTTLKETVIGVAGQGIYQTVDSGIEGFIDNGVEGFKTNVVNALKQFNDPMNLIKTIGLTAVLAPGLRRISVIDKTKVPKGLDDSINNQAELRQRILKNIEESRKARESSGYKEWATEGVSNPNKSVWDNIKITQPIYNGTKIPKSFELVASGEKFWVHPNGTKHMVEYITRNPMSHGMPINSQTLLSSFQNSVSSAVKQGIKYDEIMNVGNWELIFSKARGDGLLPVIKHAVYRP